jgi:adenylate kinase family enzyme
LKEGKEISNEIYVELIRHHLANTPAADDSDGWVMDGFPWTTEQAQLLHAANLTPHYLIPIEDADEQVTTARCGKPWFNSRSEPTTVSTEVVTDRVLDTTEQGVDMAIFTAPFQSSWIERDKDDRVAITQAFDSRNIDVVRVPVDATKEAWMRALTFALDPLSPKAGISLINFPSLHAAMVNEPGDDDFKNYGVCRDYCPVALTRHGILRKGLKNLCAHYKVTAHPPTVNIHDRDACFCCIRKKL